MADGDSGSNGALAAARMGLAAGGMVLFAACALLWLACPPAGARRGIERAGFGHTFAQQTVGADHAALACRTFVDH